MQSLDQMKLNPSRVIEPDRYHKELSKPREFHSKPDPILV